MEKILAMGYLRLEICLTVVDVVQVSARVVRVVHNERTPQTITVLRGQVTVVPEGACGCGVFTADYGRT